MTEEEKAVFLDLLVAARRVTACRKLVLGHVGQEEVHAVVVDDLKEVVANAEAWAIEKWPDRLLGDPVGVGKTWE